MMQVELPITWLETFCKFIIMATFLFFGLLLSIWIG